MTTETTATGKRGAAGKASRKKIGTMLGTNEMRRDETAVTAIRVGIPINLIGLDRKTEKKGRKSESGADQGR